MATPAGDPKERRSPGVRDASFHLLEQGQRTIDVAVKIERRQLLGEGIRTRNSAAAIPLVGPQRASSCKGDELGDLDKGQKKRSRSRKKQWRQEGGNAVSRKLSIDWAGLDRHERNAGLGCRHRLNGVLLGKFDAASLVGALTRADA